MECMLWTWSTNNLESCMTSQFGLNKLKRKWSEEKYIEDVIANFSSISIWISCLFILECFGEKENVIRLKY